MTDVPGNHRLFTFAIPLDPATISRMASITLRGRGREVVRSALGRDPVAARSARAARAPAVRRAAGGAVTLAWDATTHPAVMVRDAQTGTILSIARGGRASVANSSSDLELLLSDGVRTTRTRIQP